MAFRIRGLDARKFAHLFGQSDGALAGQAVVRYKVDVHPGFPDRVTMQDLQVGETALLVNYEHLPVNSPYRSRHAIFVKEGIAMRYDALNQVPDVMTRRLLSLRAIDGHGCIVEAGLAQGDEIIPMIKDTTITTNER